MWTSPCSAGVRTSISETRLPDAISELSCLDWIFMVMESMYFII